MQDAKKNPPQNKKSTLKKIVIISSIVITVVLIDLFAFFGGHLRYSWNWIRCGGTLYQSDSKLWSGVRHYRSVPAVSLFHQHVDTYYCSPLEAERAGLSADPDTYRFPHLHPEQDGKE